MTKLTCEICIELMPLVQDGVASRDSVAAVEEHLKNCPECRALFEGQIPEPSDSRQILKKIQQKTHIFINLNIKTPSIPEILPVWTDSVRIIQAWR